MRKINWRKFKNSRIDHVNRISQCGVILYDDKGVLYNITEYPDSTSLHTAFRASIVVNSYQGAYWDDRYNIIFTLDSYCFIINEKRLSSTNAHDYYHRHTIWLTTMDRDIILYEMDLIDEI